jgi:hypothetical protein
MAWETGDLPGGTRFNHSTEVEDQDAVADLVDYGEVTGEEQAGEPLLTLEFAEQLDDLDQARTGHTAEWFVADQELGFDGHGPCEADTLALGTGELVREPPGVLGVEPHGAEKFLDALLTM